MISLELYRVKVRNPLVGKWRTTKYRLTVEEARQRYGEGNYEALGWSREVREVGDPQRRSAAHLMRMPESKDY